LDQGFGYQGGEVGHDLFDFWAAASEVHYGYSSFKPLGWFCVDLQAKRMDNLQDSLKARAAFPG
jgi:hypothetical protein